MRKILAYLYYFINTIAVSLAVLLACMMDDDYFPTTYYIALFITCLWCAISVIIYNIVKSKEEEKRNAKIRKRYTRYM